MEMKRADLVEIADECIPLLDKLNMHNAVMVINEPGEEDEGISVQFRFQKKDKNWILEIMRLDALGHALSKGWIKLGTYTSKNAYQYIPEE